MAVVAAMRMTAKPRRWTGTRETSSTVNSSASGGQAAMTWLTTLLRACSTLAAIEAATPSARVSRASTRTRRR
jgi:hypothetical protein